MRRTLLRAAALFLPLLTAGCIRTVNNIQPPPPETPPAYVLIPPPLTPQQEDCLADFPGAGSGEEGRRRLREWAIAARAKQGCSGLRLLINGEPVVPESSQGPQQPPAGSVPAVLVELPPAAAPDPAGPEIRLVERETRIEVPIIVERVVFRDRDPPTPPPPPPPPPPPCDACAICPDCPPLDGDDPPSGASGDAQPPSSPANLVTSAAIGGGLTYALLYFQILRVPGAPPATPSGPDNLPEQGDESVAAGALAAADLSDPRVRIRASGLRDSSG